MHPGFSVILFTATTGAGYGMLVLLGLLGFAGLVPADFWFGLTAVQPWGIRNLTESSGISTTRHADYLPHLLQVQ